tara:strand:+ start:681 stop:845 length:165 start_codon:yes stop_codon:yes gene_type:complete
MDYTVKKIIWKSFDVFLEKIHKSKFLPISFSIILENIFAKLTNSKVKFTKTKII